VHYFKYFPLRFPQLPHTEYTVFYIIGAFAVFGLVTLTWQYLGASSTSACGKRRKYKRKDEEEGAEYEYYEAAAERAKIDFLAHSGDYGSLKDLRNVRAVEEGR